MDDTDQQQYLSILRHTVRIQGIIPKLLTIGHNFNYISVLLVHKTSSLSFVIGYGVSLILFYF